MMGSIDFWHWLILALLLIILEIVVPGAFFLWMGVSAGVIGLILWMFPDTGWESQLLLFSVISVVSIALWRIRLNKHPTESEDNTLNARTTQYIGRVFTLVEPIEDGYGKIHVDDSYWQVSGPNCEKNKKVKVISVDGMTLKVEPV
ncbi:MAG: NfeD family protein [Gammaproteobacteria bacterium]|nr:NfeD family protein [Gammaproteobacteria bacterium]MCF6260102.1 NfeD family protein [Gammaproteobacteria bacterium]